MDRYRSQVQVTVLLTYKHIGQCALVYWVMFWPDLGLGDTV